MSEKPEPKPQTTRITFPYDCKGSHPRTNVSITRIEITDLAAPPSAADSSIARFPSTEASLSRDASGVTLKLDGCEWFWGFGRLDQVVNVPVAKAAK